MHGSHPAGTGPDLPGKALVLKDDSSLGHEPSMKCTPWALVLGDPEHI